MAQKQVFIVVGLVTDEAGRVLLARRHEPANVNAHNKWEFPGGGIDFGETPEQAVIREVLEETGLNVKIIRMLPTVLSHVWEDRGNTVQILILSYHCEIISGKLGDHTDGEIAELKFIKPEDISSYDTLPKTEETILLLHA